ncbi:uncharacterized protein L3040_001425 [Drepanopeziza brunnea f. sp. 'multigermtubi']|uniref:uncharacterized protein n=1 Tax=Drepanopeziza brunnea f. sp. 'multigermtubi' TaxID=698441 RepID=UPI0023828390|nr:hypothetical protein L3040_001425 [Drepanopeziza brunnea f. sp. 'multigermtubi']
MSPAATSGLPHTRATSISGGPVGMANGAKPIATDGWRGGNRVLPSLDELLAVRPQPEMIHWAMRRLLLQGESMSKQADTHLDFHRPEVALQDYLKASIIVVDYIPRHRDYPSLQADRGELHRLYAKLQKRINEQHGTFASVKTMIKENNARSGVTSTSSVNDSGDSTAVGNGHLPTQSIPDGPVNDTNGTNTRKRPAPPVQPKPEALHGNSIQTDLASRFALLRNPEPVNSVQQDPRIKTQPIVIPGMPSGSPAPQTKHTKTSSMSRPTGPREMPSVPQTIPSHIRIPLGVSIPTMPRAPDAIYSPASGVDDAATINLPSSIARSSSYMANGRPNFAPPVSTVGPTPDLNESRKDYFSIPRTIPDNDDGPEALKPQTPVFPDASTITAEELVKYQSQSVSILIVDLRSREEFDRGHIMSQSIICIEPMTLKNGITAEVLGETMVVVPDLEQSLFETRNDFDLVVYYDQSSKSVNARASEGVLQYFATAVYDYGYEKRVKRRPLLLVGGLDAWIDLLGPNSLRSSSTDNSISIAKQAGSARSVGRFNMPASQLGRMRSRSSRLLSSDEEMKWDLALKQEDAPNSPGSNDQLDLNEFVYARTVDAFLNKYPEMPVIQESMVSQSPPVRYKHATPDDIDNSVPQLPTRPAPALPRQRSGGIFDRTTVTSYAAGPGTISTLQVSPGLTGLDNPRYLCYFNSSIQALSATPFIRDFVRNFTPGSFDVPARRGETTRPPQLLLRFLSNLFRNMWSGQYDYVGPTSLARYVNTIHFMSRHATASNVKGFCFGGVDRQHDAAEFLLWFLDVLDDEINPGRDQRPDFGRTNLTSKELTLQAALPLNQASQYAWSIMMRGQSSMLAQRSWGQTCNVVTCMSCNTSNRNWNDFQQLPVTITTDQPTDLRALLGGMFGPGNRNTLPGLVDCDSEICKRQENWVEGQPLPRRTKVQNAYITRLPEYLMITLNRFVNDPVTGISRRVNTVVTFPETGINFEPYFCPRDASPEPLKDQEHKAPYEYAVYAVQRHSGTLDTGHYTTMARHPGLPRNDPNSAGGWHHYNDNSNKALAGMKILKKRSRVFKKRNLRALPTRNTAGPSSQNAQSVAHMAFDRQS